jgi:hypothetical protein
MSGSRRRGGKIVENFNFFCDGIHIDGKILSGGPARKGAKNRETTTTK